MIERFKSRRENPLWKTCNPILILKRNLLWLDPIKNVYTILCGTINRFNRIRPLKLVLFYIYYKIEYFQSSCYFKTLTVSFKSIKSCKVCNMTRLKAKYWKLCKSYCSDEIVSVSLNLNKSECFLIKNVWRKDVTLRFSGAQGWLSISRGVNLNLLAELRCANAKIIKIIFVSILIGGWCNNCSLWNLKWMLSLSNIE
jgi:hypothetical protein